MPPCFGSSSASRARAPTVPSSTSERARASSFPRRRESSRYASCEASPVQARACACAPADDSGPDHRSRRSACLFVEPYSRQILVEVMARADLPAFDIGPVRHHPVPPQQKDLVRLGVEHVFLELAHQRALLREIGLAQHLVVERRPPAGRRIAVVRGIDRSGRYLCTSSSGLTTLWQLPVSTTSKLPLPHAPRTTDRSAARAA